MKAVIVREMEYRDHIPHGDLDQMVAEVLRSADGKEGMAARLVEAFKDLNSFDQFDFS